MGCFRPSSISLSGVPSAPKDVQRVWGLLYVTVLKIYISNYGYLFGTAMYVDYLTFSQLNPITNPTPLLNATLTIEATAHNPNYQGSRVYPNYRDSRTHP